MTPSGVGGWLQVIRALAETIRELGRVPSGHLYARIMDSLTLEQYNLAIGTLKRAGLVAEKNHELIWTGPQGPQVPQEETSDGSSKG